METSIMETLNIVKGSDLPFHILKRLNATPYHTFRIIPETEIEYDDDGNPMPPEENFKPEFVAKIEAQQYKKDEGVLCKTQEEQDALFDKIWER